MTVRFHCPRHECQSDRCPAKSIFSCLSPAQETALGRERLARRYAAGQVVLHHDTPALAVLSIHSGRVKLTRYASEASEVVVGVREPGELLGVREVLCGLSYQVSATTLEPSVLCAIPREAFVGAVRDCPELALRLLGELAKDHLMAEEQLIARACASVAARTARLLLTLSRDRALAASAAAPVAMSREEMAMLIGTTRETLSRTLHRMASAGAVEIGTRAIHVRDAALLDQLTE